MDKRNLLRRQIVTERRKKGRVFVAFFLLALVFILFNLFYDEMGLFNYFKLKSEETRMEEDIAKIEMEISSIKDEIKAIGTDPFYIEKKAREDLGLAMPDEYIYKLDKDK
ncbi:MAG: septum formation initiator family protein [Nitrospirae bacterium]|nr:septum formation initiator family protein [Nitrospirota bacterium]MBF0590729.1 septum formation initiator family protein [Nitrospirota bacterium]